MQNKPKILALKRPTPPSTDGGSVVNDAPSPIPLSPKPSIEVPENTSESQSEQQKTKFPPLVTLPEAINASGEAFKVCDQILVTAPWGGNAIAAITLIYQGGQEVWTEYKPIEPVLKGWQWERGSCPAQRLRRDQK